MGQLLEWAWWCVMQMTTLFLGEVNLEGGGSQVAKGEAIRWGLLTALEMGSSHISLCLILRNPSTISMVFLLAPTGTVVFYWTISFSLRGDIGMGHAMESKQFGGRRKTQNSAGNEEADIGTSIKARKSKKARKGEKKDRISSKKSNKLAEKEEAEPDQVYLSSGGEDCSKDIGLGHAMESSQFGGRRKTQNSAGNDEADIGKSIRAHKSKKAGKSKKKDHISSKKSNKLVEKEEAEPDQVYHISSGDEDCSRGMKKWILEYHRSRPGLNILQQRNDEFITAHETQEEQARKDREARAAEGGWTVVVHHKGRKKTTDSESGITVGSVAQAAVVDKMAKKKSKEVGIDFYRFQRREAQRNEVMMLQSKFEQDRKRIQQLRAARKFRPY
ncbi:hypothetical protein HHK36_007063 [Tetracentron sinense]|uniref:Ribosomal RNA-processing protein 7 C-terminal domain-containing protein n=1 Tax=Tetracentron sinense TaxID=13715 RepID=A0A834ZIA2_TETSI|nr:hypothetical protein HHK36_007063 [Tetracentron sinense]